MIMIAKTDIRARTIDVDRIWRFTNRDSGWRTANIINKIKHNRECNLSVGHVQQSIKMDRKK